MEEELSIKPKDESSLLNLSDFISQDIEIDHDDQFEIDNADCE